jgi:hypothetical protein
MAKLAGEIYCIRSSLFQKWECCLSSCYVLSSSIYRTGPWIDASIEGIIVEFKPRPEKCTKTTLGFLCKFKFKGCLRIFAF